jgi:hypothetical protein
LAGPADTDAIASGPAQRAQRLRMLRDAYGLVVSPRQAPGRRLDLAEFTAA